MRLNKYIQLKRGSLRGNAAMMTDCKKALEGGNSVFIFPEGTRSMNGKLQSFKKGAFEIALRSKMPIQPIHLQGSANALAKKGFVIKGPTKVKVVVKELITYESFKDMTASELRDKMHAQFEQWQNEL